MAAVEAVREGTAAAAKATAAMREGMAVGAGREGTAAVRATAEGTAATAERP